MSTITILESAEDYWSGRYRHEVKFRGFIVPSEPWDAPGTLRIKTNNAKCPFSVIRQSEIISIDDAKPEFPATEPEPEVFNVESDSKPGTFYTVTKAGEKWTCTCPQFVYRSQICKHIRRTSNA